MTINNSFNTTLVKEREDVDPFFYDPDAEQEYLEDILKEEEQYELL